MSIKLLKKIHHLTEAITGLQFFIVGGAVVDTLYGKEPKDYDLVHCMGQSFDDDEAEAFALIERLSNSFAMLGFKTKVYQSYGVNMGEQINDTSFQAMFYSCMKVDMGHCQLDILLSKANTICSHVRNHDCNMNMVWFDGNQIRWEHGGDEAKVKVLKFRDGVCDARIQRMDQKRHALTKIESGI